MVIRDGVKIHLLAMVLVLVGVITTGRTEAARFEKLIDARMTINERKVFTLQIKPGEKIDGLRLYRGATLEEIRNVSLPLLAQGFYLLATVAIHDVEFETDTRIRVEFSLTAVEQRPKEDYLNFDGKRFEEVEWLVVVDHHPQIRDGVIRISEKEIETYVKALSVNSLTIVIAPDGLRPVRSLGDVNADNSRFWSVHTANANPCTPLQRISRDGFTCCGQ